MNYSSNLFIEIFLIVGVMIFIILYKDYLLKKSLKDINEMIDSTMEAIIVSENFICINVNKSAVSMLGYDSKEEMIGKNLFDFIRKESQKSVKENINSHIELPYEGIVQRKDKSTFYAFMKERDLPNKNMHLSSIVDISHLKNLESQAKLASMEEMISNIAHQWRQPLSIISTVATGMKVKKEYDILQDSEFYTSCEHINENAQYLSQTIENFRKFVSGEPKIIRFDLKNNTESFIKVVDSSIKKYNIQLILNLEEDSKVQGYPNELIQCFMNIFNNSRDALIENNIPIDERYIFIDQHIIENHIIIIFKDNAKGIAPDIIGKIFEPYFTTKHQYKGTGLGLNMTYNLIVKSMRGTIAVKNVTYEFNHSTYTGAEFTIRIPL